MTELSSSTKALLRAAAGDRPSAAARAKIWSGMSSGAAGATAIGATAGKAAATAGSAKLLVLGALLGSAVTVGVAAMVLGVGAPRLQPDPQNGVHADSEIAAIAPAARAQAAAAVVRDCDRVAGAVSSRPATIRDHVSLSPSDALARETELVAEARGAIVRGEPDVALVALQATHGLPARALEPEELALEVRALQALGRVDDAMTAETRLRFRFPDHALAR